MTSLGEEPKEIVEDRLNVLGATTANLLAQSTRHEDIAPLYRGSSKSTHENSHQDCRVKDLQNGDVTEVGSGVPPDGTHDAPDRPRLRDRQGPP